MQLVEIPRSIAFELRDALAVHTGGTPVAADSFPGRCEVGRCVDLVHQAEPTSSFHPLFEGCQHPCRPRRRFDPGPSGRDLSALFSPRGHCRRCVFLLHVRHDSTSLPPFAPRPLRRFIARMGALTPDRLTFRLPADRRSGLPASFTPPSRRSAPNHPRSPRRHLRALSATGFLSVLGFTINRRLAAPAGRIRFTCVADRRFTSSCSPPRLAATQLLSVSGSRARARRGLSPRGWRAFAGAQLVQTVGLRPPAAHRNVRMSWEDPREHGPA